jgi:hypothetical protein
VAVAQEECPISNFLNPLILYLAVLFVVGTFVFSALEGDTRPGPGNNAPGTDEGGDWDGM